MTSPDTTAAGGPDRGLAPIVLIHGLWVTARSWEGWIDRYRALGHEVVAPSWPGEGEVEDIRRDPSSVAGLGITEIVDHHERIIRALDRPPIIMGHSFGGTFTQILLDRGLGVAGVAIASAAVKGVLTLPLSTLRTAWPALRNPTNRTKPVGLSAKQFHYRFTNELDEEASEEVYAREAVPSPGRILFQGAVANFNPKAPTKVDFRSQVRAPLLFIAGERDHVSPPALVKANYKHQRRAGSDTDYIELAGRTHHILGQEGWEEVADTALAWATSHARVRARDSA